MGVPTDYHSPYPSPAREILSMHEATRLVSIRICYSDTSALRGGGGVKRETGRDSTMSRIRVVIGVLAVAMCSMAWPSAQSDAETEARGALDEYFLAWNAADNDAVAAASNFPRISFGGNGQVVVREQPADIEIDFVLLRQSEGWDHTTIDLIEAVQVSVDKVHFRVVSSRRMADGAAYRTVPALYILTNQNGHWGLQLQSILSPTFTAP